MKKYKHKTSVQNKRCFFAFYRRARSERGSLVTRDGRRRGKKKLFCYKLFFAPFSLQVPQVKQAKIAPALQANRNLF